MKKNKIILSSILFSTSLLFAGQNGFISHDSKVFLNADGKKEIGKIDTATPVEILSSKGNFKEIKVVGWGGYGFENVLFKDVGERVFYLVLNDNKTKKPKELAEKTDSFETQWKKVSYTLWVNEKSLTTNIDEVYKEGQELFVTRCGSCHVSPEIKHYTTNQWPNIIEGMKSRAGLTKQDVKYITKYIQAETTKGKSHE